MSKNPITIDDACETLINSDMVNISDLIVDMEYALKAARVLCANLETVGCGTNSLVENFRKLDEKIN